MAEKSEKPRISTDGAREWLKANPPGGAYRAMKGWIEQRNSGTPNQAEITSEMQDIDLAKQETDTVLVSIEGLVDRLVENLGGEEAAEEFLYSIEPGLETVFRKDFSEDDMDRLARQTVENGKISVIIGISLVILIARRKSKPLKWTLRFIRLARQYWQEKGNSDTQKS